MGLTAEGLCKETYKWTVCRIDRLLNERRNGKESRSRPRNQNPKPELGEKKCIDLRLIFLTA